VPHEALNNLKRAKASVTSVKGGGKPPRQSTPTMTTPTRGPWMGPLWMTWYPPWYPMVPSLPPVAPTSRKSFLTPFIMQGQTSMPMSKCFRRPSKPMGRGMI